MPRRKLCNNCPELASVSMSDKLASPPIKDLPLCVKCAGDFIGQTCISFAMPSVTITAPKEDATRC